MTIDDAIRDLDDHIEACANERAVPAWRFLLEQLDELREKVEQYERDGCYPRPRIRQGITGTCITLEDGTEAIITKVTK